MLCLMRYSSVECTRVVPLSERRRLELLPCKRCRLPARERSTLPPAVILNRLAADFLVLMPFGRRIKLSLSKRARNIGCWVRRSKGFFKRFRREFGRKRSIRPSDSQSRAWIQQIRVERSTWVGVCGSPTKTDAVRSNPENLNVTDPLRHV